MRIKAVVWAVITTALTVGCFMGSDTAVLSFWLYMIWTAPFGVILWQFVFPLLEEAVVKSSWFQAVGLAVVDVITFAFWFGVVPWLKSKMSADGDVS